MEQIELYELLEHLDDIAIIERHIHTLTYGQEIQTESITVRRFKFFDLETASYHEPFDSISTLLTFVRKYC